MTPTAADLLAGLGDGVVVVSEDGRVLGWYGAAERLFGYDAAEIMGGPAARVLPERPFAEGPQRMRLPRRDGGEFDAVVTSSEVTGVGTAVLVKGLDTWFGPDRQERSPAAGAVAEALGDAFRRTMEVAAADFPEAARLEESARVLAAQGRSLLPDCDCLVLRVAAGSRDRLRVIAGAGPWADTQAGLDFALKGAVLGRALGGRSPLEVQDIQSDPVRGKAYRAGGLHTLRAVPLHVGRPLPDGRDAIGLIAFYSRRPRPFDRSERRLIDDFGQLVAISLLRAELDLAAQRSAERLRTVVDVAVDLAQSLDVKEVIARTIKRAMAAVGAERGVLLRVLAGETIVEDAYDLSGRPDVPGFRQPVSEQPLMARAIEARRPLLGGRYDISKLPPPLAEALADVRHTATVPLQLGGEVAAVLVLSKRGDAGYAEDDVETLQLLGSVAVLALRNAWLFEEVEEAGRVKSDFLSMAAHELRTPLTVITGYLSMLQEGSLGGAPAGWGAPLEVLGEKVDELGRLVEDLLLAARLETGRLPYSPRTLDLRELASAVVAQRRQRTGHEVLLELPDRPVLVEADPDQLLRVLGSLVANALTYDRDDRRPWARVTVSVRGRRALVSVEDRGRGIPARERERIFERFYRADDRRHSPKAGTGLGLYIARTLAQRFGGRVELRSSRLDVGSRFEVTVPLKR